VAACLGATWIAGGVVGTIELLAQSLRPEGSSSSANPTGGSYRRRKMLPGGVLPAQSPTFSCFQNFLASFGHLGYDVVEMVLADQDSWDRYEAAKWLTMRRWLEANPDDEFAKDVRAKLTSEPERYAACTREYLGWGVFALMTR